MVIPAYHGLFEAPLSEATLTLIQNATNKGWILGNDRFREEIELGSTPRSSPAEGQAKGKR